MEAHRMATGAGAALRTSEGPFTVHDGVDPEAASLPQS